MAHVLSPAVVLLTAVACFAPPGPGAALAQREDRQVVVSPRDLLVQRSSAGAIGVQVKDPAVSEGEGAYVTSVNEGGPAAKAGIQKGDLIVEFDGERVRSAAMLTRLVRETPADRVVKVVVARNGKRHDLTLTVERGKALAFEMPDLPQFDSRHFSLEPPLWRWQVPEDRQQLPAPRVNPRFAPPLWFYSGPARLGVTVQDLTDQLAEYFGAKQGVLVSGVVAGGPAAKAGVRAGDVITAIDAQQVGDAAELRRSIADKKGGDQVTVTIVRDRRTQSIKVTLEDEKQSV